MSQPGERVFTWDNDVYSKSSGFRVAEEKTEVAKDEKTVKDDYEDYIYKTPRRKRKRSSSNSSRHKSHRKSHKRRDKKNKMKPWKKVLLSVVCICMAIILVAVGTTAYLFFKGQDELFTDDVQITVPKNLNTTAQEGGKYIVYNGETYKYNDKVTSLLFMGVDKRDLKEENVQGTGGQADVIVLMALNFKNRKLSLISIPRDLMTDVSVYSVAGYYTGMQRQQICLSYAYGDGKETSCTNTVASVKRVFYNIPINTYYALDLDGISAINDAVGGIDVISPETIDKFTEGQSYHLTGADSESFVRARVHNTAEANNLRMKRQQIYAQSFMNKVMTEVKKDPSSALRLFNESSPYSCTNLDPAKITYIAQDIALHGSLKSNIVMVPGNTTLNKDEKAEFTISEKEFYEQFLSVFYEKM